MKTPQAISLISHRRPASAPAAAQRALSEMTQKAERLVDGQATQVARLRTDLAEARALWAREMA